MSQNASPPPPSRGSLPSSFESNTEFYEEGWVTKLGRRMKEEPLIPLGMLATCYALYGAARSMRQGKSYDVNRYFRYRVYAQGFTLVCVVAGGFYYKDDRMKRAKEQKVIEEAKAAEKREKWLKELEIRDQEDKEWRERHENVERRAREAVEKLKGENTAATAPAAAAVKNKPGETAVVKNKPGDAKTVVEEVESRYGWLKIWGRR